MPLKFMPPCFAVLMLGAICQAQPTQLGIDRGLGLSRITLLGETDRDYTLVGNDLSSTNWSFLATLTLTNSSQPWFDSDSAFMPKRFYRAVKLDNTIPEYADDFRLIDQQGKSRELYYYQKAANVQAFVLIFTGNGCTNVQSMVSTIKSLRDQFSPQGVIFWMIDANSADNR